MLHVGDEDLPHITLEFELVLEWRLTGLHEREIVAHLRQQRAHAFEISMHVLANRRQRRDPRGSFGARGGSGWWLNVRLI